jgi:dTMP kinase
MVLMTGKEGDHPGGRFIALDGPDGGGKTTQAARLVEWLRARGFEVVACRDPGGTALGERLRSILLDKGNVPIGLRAEMLLFMASRAQLVEEVIRPALAAGKVVISDRFVLANMVYQGVAGGLDVDEVRRVGMAATGGLWPDLTVVVDVPPAVATARVGGPRDRIEDRGDEGRRRLRDGFLGAAGAYPAPLVIIDGTADVEAVASRLQAEVARALAIDPRP